MPNWLQKLLILPPGQRKKVPFRKFAAVFAVLFALLLFISHDFRYWVWSFIEYPIHYREYKHFGIRIPGGYQIHGIDVSRYQSKVDWKRVKKMDVAGVRISFAFIKATEGTWLVDPEFSNNWTNARSAGVIRGAYHYFLPNLSPKEQAIHFTKQVKLRSGDLPPVVDVEETRGMNKAQIVKYTKEFLNLLEKQYKVRPILYTNRDFYKNYFAGHPDFENYRFWIAHYHVLDFDMPGEEKWHFWQHSDRGNVNGINEKVDFNVFNGDSLALRKLCIP